MRYFVTLAGRTVEVDLGGGRPRVDGREVDVDLCRVPGGALWHIRVDGSSHSLELRRRQGGGEWEVTVGGRTFEASAVDERTRAIRELTGGQEGEAVRTVVAPMPGLVVRVEVTVGQEVAAGEGVIVVEAMKMENELKAGAAGTVARIDVEAGQTVEKGDVLLVLE